MEILGIISRDLQKASTWYRLVQYLEFLKRNGIGVEFVRRKEIDAAVINRAGDTDLVFNQKCLFKSSRAKRLIDNSKRTIFDFDDAIYTRPGKPGFFLTRIRVLKRLKLWLTRSDIVTTANGYLAGYARKYSENVVIVPMAIDLDIWRPLKSFRKDKVVIGWAGAPVNVHLLERLDPVLSALTKRYPAVRVAVFSGKKPQLSFPFQFFPYKQGKEAGFVQRLDIGLLPLHYDHFSKGKSPIKAIQYLACGLPVVGNIMGATREILNEENSIAVTTHKEWLNALMKLIENRKLSQQMGEAGRSLAERQHNIKKIRERFLNVLRDGPCESYEGR